MGWRGGRNLHALGDVVGGGHGGREVGGVPHREVVGPCSGVLHDVVVHEELQREGVEVQREGALHDEEVHGEVCVEVVPNDQTAPCDAGDDDYRPQRVGAILLEHGVEDEDYSHHLIEYLYPLLHLLGEKLDIWSSRSYRRH
jgi:hypothetical protein